MIKKPAKDQRERQILLGVVELYLQTGKPVGSQTLREQGFESFSPATIRNYFAKLEEGGYLRQQHSSGGRIPTALAYKVYVDKELSVKKTAEEKGFLPPRLLKESREVASYLQQVAELLSERTCCAVFLSAPRFDHDVIIDIKLMNIDPHRCLCALITDFGLVHTEVLYTEKKLSTFSLKRIESYLQWKINRITPPDLEEGEEVLASHFYNELMLRHIVRYTNFTTEDIYKTGFAKLLSYADLNDPSLLASGLALFENSTALRSLLKECCHNNNLTCWVGGNPEHPLLALSSCSVLAIPYRINQTSVGALALLGPHRIPYKKLFGILETAALGVSDTLTKSLYKFKISFRRPTQELGKEKDYPSLLDQTRGLVLEDKREDKRR